MIASQDVAKMDNKPKILFVDDDRNVLMGLSLVLKPQNIKWDILYIDDPETALIVLRQSQFNVLVTDMRMPKISGAQLITKVKSSSPGIVCIMLTGDADLNLAIQAVNQGEIFRFLTKPCLGSNLIKAIEDAVELNRLKENEHLLLETIKEQNKIFLYILEATNAGTWEWDINTGKTTFNERWAEIVGYTLEELFPTNIQTWKSLAHPDDILKSDQLIKKHLSGETTCYTCDVRMLHKSGEWVWVKDHGKISIRDKNGIPLTMYGTHIDINEIKQNESRLLEMSIRDPLTNLYNRRYITNRLSTFLSKWSRSPTAGSVAIIDLDHFKIINDTFGHLGGDSVLVRMSSLIKDNVRPYDLVGRYGGEEFIVIFDDTDKYTASKVVNRILSLVNDVQFGFEGQNIRVTFSCGIADSNEFDLENLSIGSITALADLRMYKAKNGGRNKIVDLD